MVTRGMRASAPVAGMEPREGPGPGPEAPAPAPAPVLGVGVGGADRVTLGTERDLKAMRYFVVGYICFTNWCQLSFY